jgi:hypothetical protein
MAAGTTLSHAGVTGCGSERAYPPAHVGPVPKQR